MLEEKTVSRDQKLKNIQCKTKMRVKQEQEERKFKKTRQNENLKVTTLICSVQVGRFKKLLTNNQVRNKRKNEFTKAQKEFEQLGSPERSWWVIHASRTRAHSSN